MDKIRIARYACENGNSKTVSKFKKDFPKLNESAIRPWVKKYKSELSNKRPQTSFTIGTKRGRPTILSEELDQKIKSNDSKFDNSRGSYKHSCCTWCLGWDST